VTRRLLALVEGEIHRLQTALMRWKCAACGATFRHYPPGVAPRKHYLPAALLALCRRYVQEEQASYRRLANSAGLLQRQPLFYAGPVAEQDSSERHKALEHSRALAHATLWRWLGVCAVLWVLARQRGERHQLAADRFDLAPWNIPPRKYRSAARQQILIQAAQVLAVYDEKKYSTDFATLYAGP
jgi:hypothetical protein